MFDLQPYNIKTQLYIQNDYITPLKANLQQYGQSCIILTGKSSYIKTNTLQPIQDLLQQLSIKYHHSPSIVPNPTHQNIYDTFNQLPFKPDFIIALGGGSVLDAAKALAFLCGGLKNLSIREDIQPIKLVAVCLASGAGSEVTQYSALINNNIKAVIPNFAHFDLSITPYDLQKSLPPIQQISTFWDIFCHSFESALNKNSQPLNLELALKAVSLLKKRDLKSKATAAILAGISISKCPTSVPHGMSYALTSYKQIPHGIACVYNLCDWLEIVADDGKNQLIQAFCADLEELRGIVNGEIGKKIVLSEEEIEVFTGQVVESGKLDTHKGVVDREWVRNAYMSQ